jgi:hypothetical protein
MHFLVSPCLFARPPVCMQELEKRWAGFHGLVRNLTKYLSKRKMFRTKAVEKNETHIYAVVNLTVFEIIKKTFMLSSQTREPLDRFWLNKSIALEVLAPPPRLFYAIYNMA